MTETFDWLKPAPLWAADGSDIRADLFAPTLLQFKTDQFMDEFFALTQAPNTTAALQGAQVAAGSAPVKLYQPAHSRYYLVCASLCCRQPGFPSRVTQRAEGDSLYYVLRKISNGMEHGWTVNGEQKNWQAAGSDALPGEERLPLFTTVSRDGRLLAFGYVPVASRETYSTTITIATPDATDTRLSQFTENVTRPLTALLQNAGAATAEVKQEITIFMLLDMVDFFQSYMPNLIASLRGQAQSAPLTSGESTLLTYLQSIKSTAAGSPALALALTDAANNADAIRALNGGDPLPLSYAMTDFSGLDAATLENAAAAALPAFDPAQTPAPQPADLPKLQTANGDYFVLRCVYERDCDTPLPPQRFVSRPSLAFDLAGFFDGDAPARPIRIALPTDISIAAMRKFQKNVGFQMSNTLRNKMAMVTGNEKNLLKDSPAPGGEGGFTLGFICSFSIQIIFIVAFMLLLIFVFVLNIVFWWLPFFRICLPIPMPARKSG